MSDEREEDREPIIGETRLTDVRRDDGTYSVEVEVYTGSKWISFDEMLNGKFKEGEGTP